MLGWLAKRLWGPGFAALAALGAPPAAESELVLKPGQGQIIDAWINNQPVRLRVDPEAPGYVILNRDAAWRVRLYPTRTSAATIIGPVRVSGNSRVTGVVVGGATSTRRVVWTDRKAVDGADGIISPADLDVDRVTLQLRPAAPGEAQVDLPMLFSPTIGLYQPRAVGGLIVHFRISTARPATLATAAAGALLAQEYGGAWSGEPEDMMIKYGIVRPVRPLALERPAPFSSQPLTSMLVRTSDHRGNAVLPEDPSFDPDEIVVTAQTGRQQARYMVSLGLDWLGACSSISWNNLTRRMTLSCAAGGGAGEPSGGLMAPLARRGR